MDCGSCVCISPPRTNTCPCVWPKAKILDLGSDSCSQVPGLAHETLGGTVPCRLGQHDGLMRSWGYFVSCSYKNYYIPFLFQKGFPLFFYYIAIREVKGLVLPSLSLQWAVSRTRQKEKPLQSLICLSFLICLHFLSLFPHKFKRHNEFSGQTLQHLNFSFCFVYLSNALSRLRDQQTCLLSPGRNVCWLNLWLVCCFSFSAQLPQDFLCGLWWAHSS